MGSILMPKMPRFKMNELVYIDVDGLGQYEPYYVQGLHAPLTVNGFGSTEWRYDLGHPNKQYQGLRDESEILTLNEFRAHQVRQGLSNTLKITLPHIDGIDYSFKIHRGIDHAQAPKNAFHPDNVRGCECGAWRSKDSACVHWCKLYGK